MKLVYIGPNPAEVGVVPLPEGWPSESHEENNREIADAKLASKMYTQEKPPARAALSEEGD